MRLRCTRHASVCWLVAMALLFATLAPSLVMAVDEGSGPVGLEICAGHADRTGAAATSGREVRRHGGHDPVGHDPVGHDQAGTPCPFCRLSGDLPAMPRAASVLLPSPSAAVPAGLALAAPPVAADGPLLRHPTRAPPPPRA